MQQFISLLKENNLKFCISRKKSGKKEFYKQVIAFFVSWVRDNKLTLLFNWLFLKLLIMTLTR